MDHCCIDGRGSSYLLKELTKMVIKVLAFISIFSNCLVLIFETHQQQKILEQAARSASKISSNSTLARGHIRC